MASKASDAARAAALKDEGNKLYVAKDYPAAHAKYTEAIEADNENAVLWANRGACALAMNKLLDAEKDCEKATGLNPEYAKAWARLGTIRKNIGSWESSLKAYTRALELLSGPDVSQADKNIRRECELDIEYVKNRMKQKLPPNTVPAPKDDDYPWNRVLKLESVTKKNGMHDAYSSKWTLLQAAKDYNNGMDAVRKIKRIITPNGKPGFSGVLGAIKCLVHALIMEHRVFRIEDREYALWCSLQVEFETQHDKAHIMVRAGGADNIMAEFLKLKEKEDWETVRRATNITIRVLVFMAFNEGSVQRDYGAAMQKYGTVIELIRRCRNVWKDVSPEDRGEVFDAEFLRGVKCLKHDCFLMAHKADPKRFTLQELHDIAQDVLQEVDGLKEDEIFSLEEDPAAHLAFYTYPRAQALSTMGLYYREKAESLPEKSKEALSLYRQAAHYYKQGAEEYPEDDETYCFYLAFAFDALIKSGSARLTEVLGTAMKIKNAIPKMRVLWENSALSQSRDMLIAQVLAAEELLLRMKISGKIKFMDTVSSELFR